MPNAVKQRIAHFGAIFLKPLAAILFRSLDCMASFLLSEMN
jgi:hypothetical protein